jgi:histidyl-tRNA synthetase
MSNKPPQKTIQTTNSYKGVRDFYPEDMFIQDYITSVWHDVLESYGYEHYSASILEPTELYEGKTSDEIVSQQTYNFTDRGGRKITLRPEMTPTVARMIAKKRRQMAFPIRWYSMPNVFRYERPQKGRLREHWQLNVDMFGIETVDAEAEIIEIAYMVLNRFGLKDKDFVIKVNDRQILNQLMVDFGLTTEDQQKDLRNLLDRKSKLPKEEFDQQMSQMIGKKLNLNISSNVAINNLLTKLSDRGIKNVEFDPALTRGFDYYTGIVFEIFDNNPENNRSLFGGGRYDNLMEIFDDASKNYASVLAKDLRQEGIDIIVGYENKKIGDQIKRADKNGIPFIICIGDSEIKKGKFKIKDLRSGEETSVKKSGIVKFVKKNLPR